MADRKTYKLKLLADILVIPPERIDNFLVELKEWYTLGRQTDNTLRELAKAIKEPYFPDISMTWIDDGKTDKKIRIVVKEKN